MKRRDAFIILLTMLLLGGAFYFLKGCREDTPSAYSLSQKDSLELAQFKEDIAKDSLRRSAEREARWEAEREARWAANRQKWDKERKTRPMTDRQRAYLEDQRRRDSIRASQPEKFAELTQFDLNTVDSLTLVRIPLIGEKRATQILSYRRQLGGYADVAQLQELYNMPPEVAKWFKVGGHAVLTRIRVNRADFKTLVHHPYLNYEQVKDIVNHRRQVGDIKSWDTLVRLAHFSDADISRLRPYLVFD